MTAPKPTCATCWFYEAERRECRVAAPLPVTRQLIAPSTAWPRVEPNYWCGQHPELQALLAAQIGTTGAVLGATELLESAPAPVVDHEAIVTAVLSRVVGRLPALVAEHARRSGSGGGRRS